MSYFLCVDCGGSKAAVAIADSTGAVVARHTGGPSNLSYLGVDPFLEEIRVSVQAALLAAGVEQSKAALPSAAGGGHFVAAWFGVSGCDTPEAVNEITPKLCALLSLPQEPPYFLIANDTTLLAAPLSDAVLRNPEIRTCVAAVGGTGSIAASFRLEPIVDGEPGEVPNMLARVGGWGWILGDEGGGFHAGREAVRQLLREHELAVLNGAPLSPPADDPHTFNMRIRVLSFFGVKSAPELLALLHDPDPIGGSDAVPPGKDTPFHRTLAREKRLSQLSPLIFRAAFGDSEGKGGGDPLAISVLKVTAGELADQIALLCVPPTGPSAPLAIPAKSSLLVLGGSLVGVPAYRALLVEALKERGHEFAGVEYVTNAADIGARVLFNQFASMKKA